MNNKTCTCWSKEETEAIDRWRAAANQHSPITFYQYVRSATSKDRIGKLYKVITRVDASADFTALEELVEALHATALGVERCGEVKEEKRLCS